MPSNLQNWPLYKFPAAWVAAAETAFTLYLVGAEDRWVTVKEVYSAPSAETSLKRVRAFARVFEKERAVKSGEKLSISCRIVPCAVLGDNWYSVQIQWKEKLKLPVELLPKDFAADT